MDEQFRRNFNTKIVELNSKKDCSSSHLTEERYAWVIQRLKDLKQRSVKKTAKDYRLLKKYEITRIAVKSILSEETKEASIEENVEKLRKPDTCLLYVSHDELFDVIKGIHVATGHGARDVMRGKARKRYANVTKEVLQVYIDLCDECQEKKSRPRKVYGGKPTVASAVKVRGDVQLVDMEMQKEENYQFILRYEDLSTRFVWLRPLRTKRAEEVANHLTDIFCTFGSPYILQTDAGREFAKKIVEEIKVLWPACALVHGARATSGGGDQKAEIEALVSAWMMENETNSWAYGLRFVQWQINNIKHEEGKKTPHSAMFYEEARLGVESIPVIKKDVVSCLESEEELKEALKAINREASSVVSITTQTTASAPIRSDESLLRLKVDSRVLKSSIVLTPITIQLSGYLDPRPCSDARKDVKWNSGLSTSPYKDFESKDISRNSRFDSGIFTEALSAPESLMNVVSQEEYVKAGVDDEPTPAIEYDSAFSLDEMFSGPDLHCRPEAQHDSSRDASGLLGMLMVCSVCEFACTTNLRCIRCNNSCHEKPPCSKILDHESKALLCLMCEMRSDSHDQSSRRQKSNADALQILIKEHEMSFQREIEEEQSFLDQIIVDRNRNQDQSGCAMLPEINTNGGTEAYHENVKPRGKEGKNADDNNDGSGGDFGGAGVLDSYVFEQCDLPFPVINIENARYWGSRRNSFKH